MPDHGTRGMWPIAEAGESPQSKLYGLISSRSFQNERISDEQSLCHFVSNLIPLTDASGVICFISKKHVFDFTKPDLIYFYSILAAYKSVRQ